ncbi:MAG: N-acetylglutamate synthase [Gammaproteobacteria bacterium]|nr:N-acetylglutamate synthase [Gammaproteobacteria bacterium]
MTIDASQFVKWFRAATPYIHVHRNKTFVIKFDDDAVHSDGFNHLIHDLALLNSLGIQLVLVYGTRASIEKLLNSEQLSLEYHKGMRVTTAAVMDYVKEAAGKLRIEIEAKLSMGLGNTPMSNAELRVCSGNYVTAKPLGILDGVDFQFTGEIRSIDTDAIFAKLKGHEIVLVPPIGYSTTGEAFNLSADKLASSLATHLRADKLIYLMEAEGLVDSDGRLIRQLLLDEARTLLADSEETTAIHSYLDAAIIACAGGVPRVHLIDRRIDGAILQELFTRDGSGTMISNLPYDVIRPAGIDDINGILELLEPLERQGVLVERSREKLELEIDHFTVMERDGVIIACAALYPFAAEHTAEFACLAVHPEYNNEGRGEQLLSFMENAAARKKLKSIFALTTHAEHWFLERGFANAALENLPVERKALYNFQRNSKVLIKKL